MRSSVGSMITSLTQLQVVDLKPRKHRQLKRVDKRVFGDDVLTLTDTVTGNNVTKKTVALSYAPLVE